MSVKEATGAGILSTQEEQALLAPIDQYVGNIQAQIDELRKDGSDKVTKLQSQIRALKADKTLTKEERANLIAQDQKLMDKAKQVEAANKSQVDKLIAEAESYLQKNYDSQYYSKVEASTVNEKKAAKAEYEAKLAELRVEHDQNIKALQATSDANKAQEVKDENYVYKNKLYDAKLVYKQQNAAIKDRLHAAFTQKYHYIDLLRNSKFTFKQTQKQKIENYKYSFDRKQFLLKNGLYIVIILIFIALAIIAPLTKGTPLLTSQNVLNILQQASPRMFLALGVAGLILLTGTDLSIGRMVGMGMVAATAIMHQGPNTGSIFGKVFDFTSIPILGRALIAL
ncbi:MAG: galactoside ABC transporter permease, partial [Actinomycetaceae bacterium]|nr:galactoside ABC transporter permease [Actinomycetaceae bacterium]